MEEKIIALQLSKAQRDLLLKYQIEFADPDISSLCSLAIKKGNKYEISLPEYQAEDLCNELSMVSNHKENIKEQDKIDKLIDYIASYMPDPEDEFTKEYSKYSKNKGKVCILRVALEHDKRIWRKVAIREWQTLHDLHKIIYQAFDRFDEHLYTFYIPTVSATSRTSKIMQDAMQYTHPYTLEGPFPFGEERKNAAKTSINSLWLRKRKKFFYLFDFGDCWWHEITVEQVDGNADEGKYPRVIEKKGKSPPQYVYEDEEEFDEGALFDIGKNDDEDWDPYEDDTE